ncbi:HNH/ENDO VII superfamily nuclease [Marinomonas alcarazii]|uniref:HNH/ENDO VII superfamily nuclease n=1 Tax=Marinomonas alcarazii TaxID=491949 RepID=A0A318URQ4_9GAMM|nr:AHH domain-containing protein [Marinomonas alcarazii]PYF79196.1 HNH/ENDO VII superfamily nuclease [Marinomonas alcarazii]
MAYRLIATPEHISSYELSMIEADIANIPEATLRELTPAGQSSQSLLNALNTGQSLVICDQPRVPLFLENKDRDYGAPDWLLNPAAASTQITSRLSHIDYATEVKKMDITSGSAGASGAGVYLLHKELVYEKPATKTLPERVAQQRSERYKALDEADKKQYVQARFFYCANQGKQMKYGNWTGDRQPVADVSWRLLQGEKEIASGVTDQSGEVYVDTLLSGNTCVLEYNLTQAAAQQTTIKMNDCTYIKLPSFVLAHVYDDLESTPVPKTPFNITLSNNTIISGKTDSKGQVVMGPLEADVAQVEFYPEESEDEIDTSLKTLNQQLEDQLALYAEALAEDVVSEYAPSHMEPTAEETEEQAKIEQIRTDFEKAVADKINELKQQAAEFDGQTWYQKTWDIALAAGEGGMNGVTEYLPDLGSFGELLDKMQLDVPPQVVIKALATGDVDELERAFQQWQARAGDDYAEASAQMEMVLILLKDSHVRETLLSLPQRFLEAAPTDALVAMTASQATQTGIDVTAVSGATAFGAALGGVAAPITGGVAVSATLGRKSAKIAEQISDTIMSLSEALVKKRNKRTDSINGHSKHSQTPNQGKEKDHEPKHCQWQDCKTKHDKTIKYVNNGRTTRRLGFNKQWKNEQLQPWLSRGAGQALPAPFHDPKHSAWELGFKGFISPLSRQRMKQSAANPSASSPYPVQGHHLIPVSVFGSTQFKKLRKNIRLIGWDVNDSENGIFLPVFAPDMLRHDLQIHRGPHPSNYKELIQSELIEIEGECLNHCKNGNQKQLIKELHDLSEEIKGYIEDWDPKYLLREDSLQIKQALNKILKEERL